LLRRTANVDYIVVPESKIYRMRRSEWARAFFLRATHGLEVIGVSVFGPCRLPAIAAGGVLACAPALCCLGCGHAGSQHGATGPAGDGQPVAALTAAMEQRIATFCGDCHALPRPASFARDRWHFEVRRGYEFYARSGRNDLDPPPFHATLAYFRARAPQQLTFPRTDEAADKPPVNFVKQDFHLNSASGVVPEIAYLSWTRLKPDAEPVLVASDLRHGHVVAIDVRPGDRAPPRVLAQLRNPGRIEVCDLDRDGQTDLVVADLGSYLPIDHDRGQVVLLRPRRGNDGYDVAELATGLGRVADVRSADLDDDEQLDLVVAEFGWRRTGRLIVLRNVSQPGSALQFELEQFDDRPGAIDVPIHDFTGDGRPDFVALFSQEYESVDLFVNTSRPSSRMRFARHQLWSAPDLTFGSTGIELVDLDQNGTMDILYTNGDAFDNFYASPWHGVQWLENRGEGVFVHHRITDMPGAYRALPGDFDRDGDLDVIAVALLPPQVQPPTLKAAPVASIVLLSQVAPGEFARHTLERDAPYYPTLATGDFDGNGGLDFAVGIGPYVAEVRQQRSQSHYLTVWWNQITKEN
jgi:hypothetical protein